MAKRKKSMGPEARELTAVMVRGDVKVMAWAAAAASRAGMSRSEFFERWMRALFDAEVQMREWDEESQRLKPGWRSAEDEKFEALGRLLARSALSFGVLEDVIHRGALAYFEEQKRREMEQMVGRIDDDNRRRSERAVDQ